MSETYYGLNQINLEELSYEEFQKHALDLPNSQKEKYEPNYHPYADGLGGSNQGSNFMPQILRELDLVKRDKNEKEALRSKLISFAEKIQKEGGIHPKLSFFFQCWIEELNNPSN